MKGFLKRNILFILLFGVFCGFYYDSVLTKGPLNTHIWRQTDCLSLTRCYAEGNGFLEPEMHIQLAFAGNTKLEDIGFLKEKGAKYLIISDTSFLKKDFLKPFLKEPIGNFQGIALFKL